MLTDGRGRPGAARTPEPSSCARAVLSSSYSFLKRRVPLIHWLPHYSLELLQTDVIAGIVVGVVLIPQAVAYALLAEMPPVYGLYASLAPLPLYAAFTSSRHVSIGPFALVCILIADSMTRLVDPSNTSLYVATTLSLSLLVGIANLLFAVLRIDLLIALLSDSVLSGFTTASGIVIATSQFKHLLAMPIPRMRFVQTLIYIAMHADQIHPVAVIVGLGGILLLVVSAWANKRFCKQVKLPEQLLLIVVAVVGSAATDNFDFGNLGPLPVVGEVPSGLPAPSLPQIGLDQLLALFDSAIVVGLFSFVLTMSIARTLSLKYNYRTDANQELVALGLANLVGSCFGAFPVSGSLSRSALIASSAGAHCTPMHSLITSLLILLVLLFLTPVFKPLPYTTLASIVFMAVKGLLDFQQPVLLYRVSKPDLILWLVAFVATLLLGTQLGIMLSVLASLLMIVVQSMRPNTALLGRIPGTLVYKDIERFDAQQPEGVAVFRFDAPLNFANAEFFRDALLAKLCLAEKLQLQQHPAAEESDEDSPLSAVVLDFAAVTSIDSTGLRMLSDVRAEMSSKKLLTIFSTCRGPVRDAMLVSGYYEVVGKRNFFAALPHAVDFGVELHQGNRSSLAREQTWVEGRSVGPAEMRLNRKKSLS